MIMEKTDKSNVKKEKEIEKLKQKLKEDEAKHKRELERKSEEIKELDSRLKGILKEKQEITLSQEEAIYEKENILKQITDIQNENKKLHEELSQIGILKAEIKGLNLKDENQSKKVSELEQSLREKDEIITQLRSTEAELRAEIRIKINEITQKESEINQIDSDKLTSTQLLEQSKENTRNLESQISQLNESINNQESEIGQLKQELEQFKNENNQLNKTIKDKDEEILRISEEIDSLLSKNADLEKERNELNKGIEEAETGIISKVLPNIIKGDNQALSRIKEIAQKIKHNAVIAIPQFDMLPKILNLENLRASTQVRIMAFVDFANLSHKQIFNTFNRPNILIRHYEEKNLWGIIRDQEELLIAPTDSNGIPVGMVVKNPNQIQSLGTLLLDTWGKCRRNVTEDEFST